MIKRNILVPLCLSAIVLASLWLRVEFQNNASLAVDERVTMFRAVEPIGYIWRSLSIQGPATLSEDISPPLYHLIIHFFAHPGNSDFMVRLPGILAGSAVVILCFFIANHMFGLGVALCSALLTALNLFLVDISQNVRPYSLLIFFSALTLYGYLLALRGKKSGFALLTLGATASLYTSYTAFGYLVGIASHLVLYVLSGIPGEDRPVRGRIALSCKIGACFVIAGLLYGIWFRPHLFALRYALTTYPSSGNWTFPWESVAASFNDIFLHGQPASHAYLLCVAALSVLGLVRAAKGRGLTWIALLVLWGTTPLWIFVLSKADFPFYARRFLCVSMSLSILVALGIEAVIAAFTDRVLPRQGSGERFRFVLVLLAALVFSAPNLRALEGFKSARVGALDELAMNTLLVRGTAERVYTPAPYAGLHAALAWRLPGLLAPLEAGGVKPYERVLVYASPDTPRDLPGMIPVEGGGFNREFVYTAHRLGVLTASPLVMVPGADGKYEYSDDFSTPKCYRDSAEYSNASVDIAKSRLGVFKRDGEALVRYEFQRPEAYRVDDGWVEIEAVLAGHPLAESEDTLVLAASGDSGTLIELARFEQKDFGGSALATKISKRVSLPRELLSGVKMSVIVRMHGGMTLSAISVSSLRVGFAGGVTGPLPDPAGQAVANLGGKGVLSRWNPGVTVSGGHSVNCFALKDDADGFERCGSPAERKRFLALYPGLQPLRTITDASGVPVYEVYDPYLTRPFIELDEPGDRRIRLDGFDAGARLGFAVQGRVDFPVLDVGRGPSSIGVRIPKGALYQARHDRRAEILFRPVFSGHLYDDGQFFTHERVRKLPQESALTCEGNGSCSMTWLLQSDGLLDDVEVSYLPRLFNDPQRRNQVELSYSIKDGEFSVLDTIRSDGGGKWTSMNDTRTIRLPLDKPVRTVILKVTMISEGSQIWSTVEAPMTVYATSGTPGRFITDTLASDFKLNAAWERQNAFELVLPSAPMQRLSPLIRHQHPVLFHVDQR